MGALLEPWTVFFSLTVFLNSFTADGMKLRGTKSETNGPVKSPDTNLVSISALLLV